MSQTGIQDGTALTLGLVDLLVSARNVGSLKDAAFKLNVELKEHQSGRPLMTDKRVPIKMDSSIEAKIEELNAANFQLLMGLNAADVIAQGAGTATITDQAVVLTNGDWAKLPNADLAAVTAVRKLAGGAGVGGQVTFVEYTDFVIDLPNGRIRRNPASATLTTGLTVYVTYDYKTYTGKRFPLGKFVLSPELADVEIQHKYPDGSLLIAHFYKAQVTSAVDLSFNPEDWLGAPITLAALADRAAHSGDPYGYIEFRDV